MRAVFLDTGAQFALISQKDKHHKRTHTLFEGFIKQGIQTVTTDYVIDELLTLISARIGKHRAIEYSKRFPGDEILLIFVTHQDFYAAKRLFEQYRDKQWSFTDCVSFAVMRRLQISEVLSFDRHFTQAGFKSVR